MKNTKHNQRNLFSSTLFYPHLQFEGVSALQLDKNKRGGKVLDASGHNHSYKMYNKRKVNHNLYATEAACLPDIATNHQHITRGSPQAHVQKHITLSRWVNLGGREVIVFQNAQHDTKHQCKQYYLDCCQSKKLAHSLTNSKRTETRRWRWHVLLFGMLLCSTFGSIRFLKL